MEDLYAINHKYKAPEIKSYCVILFNYFSIIANYYTRFFKVVERLLNYSIVEENLITWFNNRVRPCPADHEQREWFRSHNTLASMSRYQF